MTCAGYTIDSVVSVYCRIRVLENEFTTHWTTQRTRIPLNIFPRTGHPSSLWTLPEIQQSLPGFPNQLIMLAVSPEPSEFFFTPSSHSFQECSPFGTSSILWRVRKEKSIHILFCVTASKEKVVQNCRVSIFLE